MRAWLGTRECANILDILEALLELTLDAKEACPRLLLLLPPSLRAAQPHRQLKSSMLQYSLWPTAIHGLRTPPQKNLALERPGLRCEPGLTIMNVALLVFTNKTEM